MNTEMTAPKKAIQIAVNATPDITRRLYDRLKERLSKQNRFGIEELKRENTDIFVYGRMPIEEVERLVQEECSYMAQKSRTGRFTCTISELELPTVERTDAGPDSTALEKKVAELENQLRIAQKDLGARRQGYENELNRIDRELQTQKSESERWQRGNTALVERVKEEGRKVLALSEKIKSLEVELEKTRAEATGKESDMLPSLSKWSKSITRINGQLSAVLGSNPISDGYLLSLAGMAQMSETEYITHKLKEKIPEINDDTMADLLNMVPWEKSEVYQKLAPALKEAQEKIDFLKQMRAIGTQVPESVVSALNIEEAEKTVEAFTNEKTRYEKKSESAALVADLKKEHKMALQLRQVTAPWCDERPIPILIMTDDRENYRLSFPVSENTEHTFEKILSGLIVEFSHGEGFLAAADEATPGMITISETSTERLIYRHFTTGLAEKLSATGLSEFGLAFEIYALTKARSQVRSAARQAAPPALRGESPQGASEDRLEHSDVSVKKP